MLHSELEDALLVCLVSYGRTGPAEEIIHSGWPELLDEHDLTHIERTLMDMDKQGLVMAIHGEGRFLYSITDEGRQRVLDKEAKKLKAEKENSWQELYKRLLEALSQAGFHVEASMNRPHRRIYDGTRPRAPSAMEQSGPMTISIQAVQQWRGGGLAGFGGPSHLKQVEEHHQAVKEFCTNCPLKPTTGCSCGNPDAPFKWCER